MFQHSHFEIGSMQKRVLIHFNSIETQICKITVLHTCVSIMLKCIRMQNLIEWTMWFKSYNHFHLKTLTSQNAAGAVCSCEGFVCVNNAKSLGNIKLHLPIGLPKRKAVKNFLQNKTVLQRMNVPPNTELLK